jgi:hypothetical protein
VDVLDTFDDGLLKLSGEIGDPPLIIRKPFFEVQLDLFWKNTHSRAGKLQIELPNTKGLNW